MSESQLFVTLGHNSSAAFAVDGKVVRAYEQERIDRKKSSSAYPREAIDLAVNGEHVDQVFISHWFDDMRLRTNKYFDADHMGSITEFANDVMILSEHFTHHDAHATSACSFFRSNGGKCADALIFVVDGFGNNRECFSVYRNEWPMYRRPRLQFRSYGYNASLGLMYQYVTEYLGLKPNKDEYKLLGYESHILEHTSRLEAIMAREVVTEQALLHIRTMMSQTDPPVRNGELINYAALKTAKAMWFELADRWRQMFPNVNTEAGIRACVAFCAQSFLEVCVTQMIAQFIPEGTAKPHILLAGGCFYNVKLNRRIQLQTKCQVFSHPLAGDQGAAMGFDPTLDVSGLKLGARKIGERTQLPFGLEVIDETELAHVATQLLAQDKIVNVVRGAMEYGPRALCNTTTLALPTRENVRRINALNERDEAMPMAPVCTPYAAQQLFTSEILDIPVSREFMITTVAFRDEPPASLMGVAHKDPLDDVWTARPQVVTDDWPLAKILSGVPDETLINTSFNYHGEPIVFTEDDACKTHEMQCQRAVQLDMEKPITLLVRS